MGKRLGRIENIIWELEDELSFFQTFCNSPHADKCIEEIEAELDRLYEAVRPDLDRIERDQESMHGFAMQILADERRSQRNDDLRVC